MTCWCEQLCAASWVEPVRRPGPDEDAPVPGFATLESFRLVCGDVRASRPARPPRECRAVPHGGLWHAVLARHLCVLTRDVEAWCVDPETMLLARSRSIAVLTGLPLALLRPVADA